VTEDLPIIFDILRRKLENGEHIEVFGFVDGQLESLIQTSKLFVNMKVRCVKYVMPQTMTFHVEDLVKWKLKKQNGWWDLTV
jgi:hypothetical protein